MPAPLVTFTCTDFGSVLGSLAELSRVSAATAIILQYPVISAQLPVSHRGERQKPTRHASRGQQKASCFRRRLMLTGCAFAYFCGGGGGGSFVGCCCAGAGLLCGAGCGVLCGLAEGAEPTFELA